MLKDLCFEIIQKCPNKCVFCSSNACKDMNKLIPYKNFKQVIDYLIELGGIEKISISGGEPFLHPDLLNMIMYAKNKGIKVILFTSGIKYNSKMSEEELETLKRKIYERYKEYKDLTEDKIAKYVEREISVYRKYNDMEFTSISNNEMQYLKYIGLDKIVFDFQGAEKETYEYLMGSKHFEIVESSMIRAVKAGLDTDVHFIPMKHNYKELPDLIEILNIAGIKNLSILNFVPQGRGKNNQEELELSEEEFKSFQTIYNENKEKFKGNIRVGVHLLEDDTHKCTAGFDKLVIKYDGTILPCPAFKEIDSETLKRNGFNVINIFDNLEELKIYEGTRKYPLCKKIYGFNKTIE